MEECVVTLNKLMSKEDIDHIKNISKKDMCRFHHTLGR